MSKSSNGHLNTKDVGVKAKALLNKRLETKPEQEEIMLTHSSADIAKMSAEFIQKLVFDLQTHQIELKMQNDELNKAHHKLTASRDNYVQLYDSSPVGYLTLNKAGIIQKANIAAATLLGFSKLELINQRLSKFICPSDQDNYYLFIRNLLTHKTSQTLSAKLHNGSAPSIDPERKYMTSFTADLPEPSDKSRMLTYVELCARVVYNEKNTLQIHLNIIDVTERKQAQETITRLNKKLEEKIRKQNNALTSTNLSLLKTIEQLRHSKRQLMEREVKLNSIFNAAVEGIITIDATNIIVSANAAVKAIFGFKPEELIGCSIKKIIPSQPQGINASGDHLKGQSSSQIWELEGKHKNGSIVPLDLSIAEFSIENEPYLTHIVRDVSSRKHQEQQDKEHLNELAHVTRLGLMGEMASGIAHEVNQPLSAISSYTQVSLNLINTEKPDLVMLAEVLHKTQQQALRAGRIIYRMRDFVKSHTKHRSTEDINTLIYDAVGLCAAELKQNDIHLAFKLESNLPPVYVDHIQIEQIIINLIRNSSDALLNMPFKKQRRLTINSHLTPLDDIQVRIKDNGPGLTEDQQQKILTPFYTTKTGGMGMGLSISLSLIQAHEGTLHFNSELGKGCTFYFNLPTRRKSDER